MPGPPFTDHRISSAGTSSVDYANYQPLTREAFPVGQYQQPSQAESYSDASLSLRQNNPGVFGNPLDFQSTQPLQQNPRNLFPIIPTPEPAAKKLDEMATQNLQRNENDLYVLDESKNKSIYSQSLGNRPVDLHSNQQSFQQNSENLFPRHKRVKTTDEIETRRKEENDYYVLEESKNRSLHSPPLVAQPGVSPFATDTSLLQSLKELIEKVCRVFCQK